MPYAIDQDFNSGRTVGVAGLGIRRNKQGTADTEIHDGDTIVVRAIGNFGVRFLGVDAAEISFTLPGKKTFKDIGDPAWEAFLADPFAASLAPFKPALDPGLRAELAARAGPGAATNHADHALAAKQALVREVKSDLIAMGTSDEDFRFHLSFATDILDRYGRMLCYLNRQQPDPNVPAPRPPAYNERLLAQGLVSPYFIWPNVDPFRRQPSLTEAARVLRPGMANHVATTEPALKAARAWVAAARNSGIGIFAAGCELRLQPFEVRFLARRQPPDRWLIDLGKSDDIILKPQSYYRVANIEDRLYIPTEFLPLFELNGWRREP